MNKFQSANFIIIFFVLNNMFGCKQPAVKNDNLVLSNDTIKNDYLLLFTDTIKNEVGYKNTNGNIIIPVGKYKFCYTDTFKTFAVVLKQNIGFVAIDRLENVLYKIFLFDNGPDEPSEGLFRIIENNKVGFADAVSGKILIRPQFDCAFPFEDGVAQVSTNCTTKPDGEHSSWKSDHWFYIDKTGKKINK